MPSRRRLLVLLAALSVAGCGGATSYTPGVGTRFPPVTVADQVAYLPTVTSGVTTLTLDPGAAAALGAAGISVSPAGRASAAGGDLSFPVTGGFLELHSDHGVSPGYVLGSVLHDGSGLTLSSAGHTVTANNFVADPGTSVLTASAGAQPALPLLSLDGSALRVQRSFTTLTLSGTVARLTAAGAAALDSALATTALHGGLALGTVSIRVGTGGLIDIVPPGGDMVSRIAHLGGETTQLLLDPATLSALKGLGISVAPTGSATLDPATVTVTFPITSGYVEVHSDRSVTPGYVLGVVSHAGSGLVLRRGDTSVRLSDFEVDPGDSLLVGSADGTPGVPLLDLDGSALVITPVGTTVQLFGTVASLTPAAASALNSAFATSAFRAGMPLGTVRLTAQAG